MRDIYKAVGLSEVLAAKNERVAMRESFLEPGYLYLCYGLNIVGEWKRKALYDYFYELTEGRLLQYLAKAGFVLRKTTSQDTAAGLWTIYAFSYADKEAAQALSDLKKLCCAFEEQRPAYRLMDLDVFDEKGNKLSRPQHNLRSCLLCDRPAYECGASRRHATEELIAKSEELMLEELKLLYKQNLVETAESAMLKEVALTPKPGLVDANNTGSHVDMDISSFKRSVEALRPHLAAYIDLAFSSFADLLKFSEDVADFDNIAGEDLIRALTEQGKKAERDSLRVNDGVNCHLGLNYAWAYLLPAAALHYARTVRKFSEKSFACNPEISFTTYLSNAQDILAMTSAISTPAYHRWRKKYPDCPGGARQNAALGYPLVLEALNIISKAKKLAYSDNGAACLALLSIMAENEDSNILRRGSQEDLEAIYERSEYLLSKYILNDLEEKHISSSVAEENEKQASIVNREIAFIKELESFDQDLCNKRLSPGGSADLLALTLFFDAISDTDKNFTEDIL